MNVEENYKRLFKGRIGSNDAKLISEDMSFEDLVDIDALQKGLPPAYSDEQRYESNDEIIIPLKKGMEIDGKKQFSAFADVFDGGTSFLLDDDLIDALEDLDIDEYDFKSEMEEYLF